MSSISPQLRSALESFCGGSTADVLKAKRPDDLEALLAHLVVFPSVEPEIRKKVLYLLGSWGASAPADPLIALLPSLEGTDLVNGIYALGRIGTSAAHEAVSRYREHSAPEVRRAVAHSLAKIGSPSALTELRTLAEAEPVAYVRSYAHKLLHTANW
jgi:HEAT repeat protein